MIEVKTFYPGDYYSNIYVVYDTDTKDSIIIDFGIYCDEVIDFIDSRGLNLHALLITHAHFDHIGGLAEFDRRMHKPILIPEKDLGIFNKNGLASFFYLEIETPVYTGFIKIPEMQFGSLKVKVIETPGHSAGSVCFLCGDNLFSGDTLFYMSYGRYDLESANYHQLKESLKKLFHFETNYKVFPGHGGKTTIFYERMHNPIDLI